MGAGKVPPVLAQLELELAGPGRVFIEPWGGLDPRLLTRSHKMFSLGASPAGGLPENENGCPRISEPSCVQLGFSFMQEV